MVRQCASTAASIVWVFQDAVRTYFSLRLAQLEGFESSDFTEPEIMEAQ